MPIVVKIQKETGQPVDIRVFGTEEQVVVRYNDQVRLVDPTPDPKGWREGLDGIQVYSVAVGVALNWNLPNGRSLEDHLILLGKQAATQSQITTQALDDIAHYWVLIEDGNFNVYMRYVE